MDADIFHLSSFTAPEPVFGQRGLPVQTVVKTPDFWEKYDNNTLIYDSVWLSQQKVVRLYLPKPFGFSKHLKASRFTLDGEPSGITRWRKFRHHDEIDFAIAQKPSHLGFTTKNTPFSLVVNDDQSDLFRGRNVLYTKLKNDDLQWVHDWGLSHQRNHGTDAILVVNNGSDAYTNAQLLETLRSIPGINVAYVLDAPFHHGPSGQSCTGVGATKFLQTACLNICRDRFLRKARAVLVCDVDELVYSRDGQSIYDATVKSPFKYKTFHGHWRFANPTDTLIRHRDHVYLEEGSQLCATKYCIVPDSWFGRMCWSIHSLENVNRRIFRPRNAFGFYHCHSVNTSWKSPRRAEEADHANPDPTTMAFLDGIFANG